MSTRAFTVFQDSPSEDTTPKPSATTSTEPISTLTSFQEHVRSTETILSPTLEKENLHPVTGLAAPPPNLSKKRKMSELGSVLATKVVASATSSTSKPPKSRELKRRASTSSASGKPKKSGLVRNFSEGRIVLGSTENGSSSVQPVPRRPSRALSRQPTTILGTVPEEPQESNEGLTQTVKQALIDSRCYELTVKPLADVSTAYLQSSAKPDMEDEDLIEYRVVKEQNGFEHKLRDYFTSSATPILPGSGSLSSFPSTSSISTSTAVSSKEERATRFPIFEDGDEEDASSVPSSPKKARKGSDDERSRSPGPVMLSTPERRQLYASFTFVTPKSSPTKSN